jgi:hypothetical protein
MGSSFGRRSKSQADTQDLGSRQCGADFEIVEVSRELETSKGVEVGEVKKRARGVDHLLDVAWRARVRKDTPGIVIEGQCLKLRSEDVKSCDIALWDESELCKASERCQFLSNEI